MIKLRAAPMSEKKNDESETDSIEGHAASERRHAPLFSSSYRLRNLFSSCDVVCETRQASRCVFVSRVEV